jgi:hypothetical protein
MPRPSWTDADIDKLRSLAGKLPSREVAAQLGRSVGATLVQASKLKLSLRMHGRTAGPGPMSAEQVDLQPQD